MKIQLRERDRRALFVLAFALGVYLLASQAVLPAYDRMKTGADSVAQKENELRRYRRALANREPYARLVEQAKTSVAEAEARLIRGDNPTLASVELQSIVEAVSTKVNIMLGQRSMTPARKRDDFFNEIAMTLSFEGTPNQVTSFLAELRSAGKFISVRNLQVSPITPAQEPPTKGELKKTLKVNVTVVALLASPPAASKG